MAFSDFYKRAQALIAEAKTANWLTPLIDMAQEAAPGRRAVPATGTATGTAQRGRPRAQAKSSAPPKSETEQVFDLIPAEGSILKSQVTLRGVPIQRVAAAIRRLEKAGRVTLDGDTLTRRATSEQRQAA